MHRRDFLAFAAASPLLQARNRLDFSRFSVLTDEVAKSPADAIAFCKQYGIRNVELRGVPGARAHYGSLDDAELKQAAKEFKDNGLRVTFLNTGFFKITLPGTEPSRRTPESPEAREKRLARDKAAFEHWKQDVEKAIRSAHAFEVDKMRVFTFLRVAEPAGVFPQIAEVIGEMAHIVGKAGLKLLVENEGACNVVTSAEARDFLKLMPQKNVGYNWDPLNGTSQKETPFPDGYELLPKNRIWNVQMKGHSILDEKRKLDWKGIFAALEKDGYKGYVGLETHYFDGTLLEKSHLSVQEVKRMFES